MGRTRARGDGSCTRTRDGDMQKSNNERGGDGTGTCNNQIMNEGAMHVREMQTGNATIRKGKRTRANTVSANTRDRESYGNEGVHGTRANANYSVD